MFITGGDTGNLRRKCSKESRRLMLMIHVLGKS